MTKKKVFVSGCYDMLHSGHVAFFRAASQYGDLYVGIGSDATVMQLKNRKTVYSEKERLYMVKAIRYVTDAYINTGTGMMDFVETVDRVKPDVFVVNTDGGSEEKRRFCEERGIQYIELQREPDRGLEARSTTALRGQAKCLIPYRLDLAGTWIDQPYVSEHGPGWALTISLEPTIEYHERSGMSTSTRKVAQKIWPYELPLYNEEMMARLLFCLENPPEQSGYISGAQDAIGICMSGLNRHYYDKTYWPTRIESCKDPQILGWLEDHIMLIAMSPRAEDCNVLQGSDIKPEKVKLLTSAAEECWDAIMQMDLGRFAKAYRDSFEAQISMFPAMMTEESARLIDAIRDDALAWKMAGAGGGGYLAAVVDDKAKFAEKHPEAIPITIRK